MVVSCPKGLALEPLGGFVLVRGGRHLLPVIVPPISLHQLTVEVDEMAEEEKVVLGRDGHGVPHEGAAVEGERGSEGTGDAVFW